MKEDLVIVTNEPFPIGMAATNRFLSYSTEIAKRKNVKVLIAKPTENIKQINNQIAEGKYQGISFKYVHGTTIWHKEKDVFYKALMLLRSYFLLYQNIKDIKPKTVLLISNKISLIWVLWYYSKIFDFKYFQEKSEKPPVIKTKTFFLYKNIYLLSYRLFDGIIVITNELKELFYSLKQNNTFHLPMTVDTNRFSLVKKVKENETFIFRYVGGGTYKRDGLLNMVKAFVDLKKENFKFEFHIVGPINKADSYMQSVILEIEKNSASDYIKLTGTRSSDEIPEIIVSSDCLIMTPPQDFDSGGFPTKLGEFLASGLPVICTNVSEIPIYLNDTNSMLIEPNNHLVLLSTLKEIIINYKKYLPIGAKGKETALQHFNINSHIDNLLEFLKLN